MNLCPQHHFQVLTKRAERLEEIAPKLKWTKNIWMGVSVENKNYMFRIQHLINTPAYIKFLSLEPLLGPLPNLKLKGIDWAIVGGESGPKARTMNEEWVEQIHQQCIKAKTAFFFKQWGGVRKHKTGRTFKGQTWDEMPKKKMCYSTSA